MTKRRILCLSLVWAVATLQMNVSMGQTVNSFTVAARIDKSSLSGVINSPIVASYDLSPDGKTAALLVVAGSNVGAPLWLITQDLVSNHLISKIDLGASVFPASGFPLQVLYASDKHYLVVQDLKQIRVFDANSLELVRAIAASSTQPSQRPLFALAASKSNVVVCAFGTPVPPEFGVHTTPAHLVAVDIVSGKVLSEWASDDVPQAISPDGEMIAISSSRPEKGILPLDLFDIRGNKIAELDGGFAFRKDEGQTKTLGRVRGLFAGNEEVLLSPDENVDQTGHHSGDSLRIVSIKGKQIQQQIKPSHYGPTGEMAISANEGTIVVISWDLPAGVYRDQEKALPVSSSPDVLVLGREPRLHLETTLPIHGLGLNLSGWLENRRPRLSSDGSVIAIAQDSGVTVLTKNRGSKPQ
jgi:WD40-like Beta Propeller Repeat